MYRPEELNDIQKQAVLCTEGAVLVTAGAGSGKTRLLTHRIAHLVNDLKVPPYNILAITFTNKAAEEMRVRLADMIDADGIWIFTFHAACVRILRKFIHKIGYNKNFTIYGEAETKAVVKRICKKHEYPEDMIKRVLSEMSNAKSKGISPEFYAETHKFSADNTEIATVYGEYMQTLKENNALDYDDLLSETLKLLKSDAEAREFYQEKFRYIHIDEFQDTNVIQYDIVKILAGKHGNIFAVGDEDQCIYTWRGASVKNIFDFQRDFNCKVFKLEQNYRSTTEILNVANRIIKGNTKRLEKKLWTANASGEPVVVNCSDTDGFEADFVVSKIYELTRYHDFNYRDCAVLLRLNALTRPYEERFLQYGIPHRVYGGIKFYDRKEVKDVLAYARISVNTRDDEAAYRIINFPRRQIGEASIEKLRAYADETGMSVYDAVTTLGEITPFGTALAAKLKDFGSVLSSLHAVAQGDVISYFKFLLYNILDIDRLFSENDDAAARLENLNELVNSVREFAKINPNATLGDYLQTVSLYSDTDDMTGDDCVTVATVHSAKGLEFPVVFVVGLEDGIFPSIRLNSDTAEHMEEERRLMYVAVTRAKKQLYLTYAKSRFLYGEYKNSLPSRFLVEAGLVERKADSRDVFSNDPSYYSRGGNGGYGVGRVRSERRESGAGSGRPTPKPFDSGTFESPYKSEYGKTEKQKPREHSDVKIAVGKKVRHKRLGIGTVIGIENMGDNVYAKIDFKSCGVMLLAVDFAPITVIEE